MKHLKVGDEAPEIRALDENGNEITLEKFRGKKVILFFYPRDNTPTCTVEACNLRDNYSDLLDRGIEVIGISADSGKKHLGFISKFNLPFPLIADVDKKVIKDYGVWGPKKFMGREFEGIHRTTFVINHNQIIEKVFTKVNTKNHAEQIVESYK